MDARNRETLSTNPPSHLPATPTRAGGKTKSHAPQHPQSTVSAGQPLLKRYQYILNNTKQEHEVHGSMSHLAQTSSQATIDVSSILKEWIWEGESDSDHESDNETASTTSGSRSPATTAASSFHEPPRHTKPIAHGVDHSMVSREVAEAFYGPFSRSNDYASHAEPSALPQEITQDVEMEDPDDRFNSDVMVFYHAATSSSEFDQVFDLAPSKSDHSHTLPPDSIYDPGCHVTDTEEFVEVFAKMRAQGMMDVEGGVRKVCSKVASKVGRKPGVAFPHQSGSGRTIYSP